LSAEVARRRRWLLCTHVSESAQEFEMFTTSQGDMYDWLKRSGRDMSDCGSVSPIRHLDACGALGKNLLAVHANYLGRGDADLLAGKGVSVVHCPRSHAYFGHAPFPMRRLVRAGVNVCLGTDSLATVFKSRRESVELNMFEEMRQLAAGKNAPPARAIVRMATMNGARALGLEGQAGEIKTGTSADLIALPFTGKPSQAYQAVVDNEKIDASMIAGQWAFGPAES
jgi:cytosine/adenosine deaminase-related metal-dependent hydrolase